jgi:hypothetical protein
MAEYAYEPLPIESDAGFPQVVRHEIGGRSYRFVLYVNVAEDLLTALPDDAVLDLPQERAYLVLVVDREAETEQPVRLLRRKLVPGGEYDAGELSVRFTDMAVAKRNLNGVGANGSNVKGGVALRWPSSSSGTA